MIPWSYSFLRDLANCPHKAYRKYVERDLPMEDSPELREGITTHKILEDFINGVSTRLPVELDAHAAPLKRSGARAEVKLGMTEDFRPAPFFENRLCPVASEDRVWGRGKADVLILDPPTAFIVDWKTGKVREDDRELRQLALLVRANYPEINRVTGCYVWLKEGCTGPLYDLTDVNRTYHGTVASMAEAASYEEARSLSPTDEDRGWPCKPNALCNWCPVADCRFNSNPRIARG